MEISLFPFLAINSSIALTLHYLKIGEIEAEIKQKFLEQGAEPRGWSPEQTAKFVRDESEKWQAVIKTTNVSLD